MASQRYSVAAETALRETDASGASVRPVGIADINKAAEDMRNSHHIVAIAKAPVWERLFLVSVFLHLQSTGTDSADFVSVRDPMRGVTACACTHHAPTCARVRASACPAVQDPHTPVPQRRCDDRGGAACVPSPRGGPHRVSAERSR